MVYVNFDLRMEIGKQDIFRLRPIVVWGILVLWFTGTAREAHFRFTHVTYRQGLSHSTVFSITQDAPGFMWFATEDGLNRFDGYRCTVYRHQPGDTASLSSTGVRRVYCDRWGNLWVITGKGELNRYLPESDGFRHYFTGVVPRINVTGLTEDARGNLWLGTKDGRLYRYLPEADRFEPHAWPLHQRADTDKTTLWSLYCDSQGTFWLGTWNGLFFWNGREGLVRIDSLPGRLILDMVPDDSGRLWIATTDGGLAVVEMQTRQVRPVPDVSGRGKLSSNRTSALLRDSRNNLWVGTIDRGVCLFPPGEQVALRLRHNPNRPHSLSQGAVFCIYQDNRGGIWIGTYGGGVNYYSPYTGGFSVYSREPDTPGSLSHNMVVSLLEDRDGTLWVGTDGGGLNRRLPGSGRFEQMARFSGTLSSNSVTALYQTRDGIIYVGTDPGANAPVGAVFVYNRATDTFQPFAPLRLRLGGITSFLEDSSGNLWIGTSAEGLYCYQPKTGELHHYRHSKGDSTSLSGNSIFALYLDSQGVVWIGTHSRGLNRFHPESGTFTCLQHSPADSHSIGSNTIWCIQEDRKGRLWVGTQGGGLNRYHRETGEFERFTREAGLPSNIVYGILPDSAGNLWLSTSRGLACFQPEDHSVRTFGVADGLPNMEFNQGAYYRGRNGVLYFGGTGGVTYFQPATLRTNRIPPPVVITDFLVHGQPFHLPQSLLTTGRIVLNYRQNFFTFRFAALDFTAPEKNCYRYRLEGLEEEWVYAGNRHRASYTSVPPGKYVFRVMGTNNDGVWSTREASLMLVITPPFWQTWWFRMMVALLTVAALVGFHQYRVQRLLEVERTRLRIAQDLHDDISGTMSGLIFFSEALNRELKKPTAQVEKLLRLIRESATSVQEAMGDIIWAINPENDRWEIIFPRFRRFASDLCESRNIQYRIDLPERVNVREPTMEQRRHLWLIYKEMVTNAVRHSGCRQLRVDLQLRENTLELFVEDDGCGFDASRKSEGNGLRNIFARAEKLNATVHLKTAPGQGTKWTLNMPLKS